MKRAMVALILAMVWAEPTLGSDDNLDRNMTTELDDATPIEYGKKEIQGVVRNTDEPDGNKMLYQPQVTLGLLPNSQLTVAVTFYSGDVDRTGSGNVSGEFLYNFLQERGNWPALAVALEAELPTGERARGVDVAGTILATKTLAGSLTPRVHVNLAWKHNGGRDKDTEKENMLKTVVGASVKAGEGTTVVLDLVAEQKEEKHKESKVLEAGMRHDLTEELLVGVGAGVGFGADSEEYRVTVGVQDQF